MATIETPALRAGRRASRFGIFILFVVIAFIIVLGSLGPYTEYLWFQQDARHPQVFSRLYETKGLLFLIGFLVSLVVFYFNLSRAVKLSMVFLDRPSTVSQVLVSRALGTVQQFGPIITKVGALVLAIFYGTGFSNEWNTYLLSRHAQPFGKVDPIFGVDLSFFAFHLPWQLAIVNFLFGLSLLVAILSFAIYT